MKRSNWSSGSEFFMKGTKLTETLSISFSKIDFNCLSVNKQSGTFLSKIFPII